MPQIREYSRQIAAVGPVEGRQVSAAAMGGDGQALEFAGKALSHVGEFVEKVKEQDDAIKVSKLTSELYLKHSQKLEDMRVSGEITQEGAFQKYREEFDADFSKVGDEISTSAGRKLLAERQATYSKHFGDAYIKGSADAKGVQAKTGMETALNNFSSGLFNNPHDINHAMSEWSASVDAIKNARMLAPEDADKIKTHGEKTLADSAIRGLMDKDPNAAKALLGTDMLDKYMDGNRKAELMNMADVAIRGLETEQKRREAEIESKRQKAAQDKMDSWLPKINNNELSVKEVERDPTLNFDEKVRIQNMIHKNALGLAKSDPSIALKTYQDISSGQVFTEQQIEERVGNGLSVKDAEMYKRILRDRIDPTTGVKDFTAKAGIYREAEKRLGKDPIAGLNPEAERRMNALRYEIEEAWVEGRKAGKSVRQLTDPTSPDYLGNLIQKYVPSTQEVFNMKFNAAKKAPQSGQTGIAVNIDKNAVAAEIARRAALKQQKAK